MVTGKTAAWWDKQTKGFICNQLALRGVRFKEWELTGHETIEIPDPKDASKTKKKKNRVQKPLQKADYLKRLKQELKDNGEL